MRKTLSTRFSKRHTYAVIPMNNCSNWFLTFPMILDAESGPYKTIQEAIDAAEPGSVIKVAPGLYSDNLTITFLDLFQNLSFKNLLYFFQETRTQNWTEGKNRRHHSGRVHQTCHHDRPQEKREMHDFGA